MTVHTIMPTTKKRINICIPSDLEHAIQHLARRDDMPEARKALQLIEAALEIEEDDVFNAIAEKRDRKGAKFVSHSKAWS